MKIYLAAAESYPNFINRASYQNIFTSFYTTTGAGKLINLLGGRKNLVVDSGAHSFFSQRLESAASVVRGRADARTDVKNVDKYVDEYCEFIKIFKDKVNYFVELDIDRVVGLEKTLQIRKRLAEVAGYDKLMVCYHPTMGSWDECKKDLFNYDYIGIQGIQADGKIQIDYATVVKDCYANAKKVHAFAMTKKSFLAKIPVYSTDSSSWKAIFRFGKSVLKDRRGLLGDFFKSQIRRGKLANEYNALEEIKIWKKFEKYFTDLWLSRGIDWTNKVKEYNI